MVHKDHYRNGVKLVSATEIPYIISKPFLETWKTKLCQCKTHSQVSKTAFKETEVKALEHYGYGHCGLVYADSIKDNAGDLGNSVHELIERWFTNKEVVMPTDEASIWASKIIEQYNLHNVVPRIIAPEGILIDDESGLCGSPDTIGEWDGRIEILDTKIKNSLDELTAMQGCAYRYLINRKHNVDIRYMRAIWCRKAHKEQDVKDVLFDLDEWMGAWKGLILVWNKLHKKRQVRIFE